MIHSKLNFTLVLEVRKILKNIEDIIISKARDSGKLEALKQYEDDIKTAKDIINGKLTYCEECKDYYLTKSFFSEKETIPTKFVCTKIRLIQVVTIM